MWEIIRNNLEPIKAAPVRSLLGLHFFLPPFSFHFPSSFFGRDGRELAEMRFRSKGA